MDIIGDRTLRDLLTEKVSLHNEKLFLLFEDKEEKRSELTYEAFQNRTNQLSQALLSFGIKKGQHVTLHLPNSLDFMVSWFALANIGAVMVPTNILSPKDEMAYILTHSESMLLITEAEYLNKFTAIRSQLPLLEDIWLARYEGEEYAEQSLAFLMEKESGELPEISLKSDDVAAMLYTSGTTSKPKGVQITHANYLFTGEVMSKSIRLTPADRQLIVLPLFHGNAQYYSAMSALTVGASIAITERFSASRYFKQAKRLSATVGSLFAAPIRMILAQHYDAADRDNLLRVIWFAQSLTDEQLDHFEQQYEVPLLQLYGMTETVGVPLMNPLDGIRINKSIGKPTIGYEVKVIDADGNEQPAGVPGQIIVKGMPGRTLMKAYFKNNEATAATIKGGWLYTGDNARVDEAGYFYFVDRIKDMIKRSGENVAASEVESVLAAHKLVYESAVIGVPDDIRDEAIKAYVILHDGAKITENELLVYCKERLASFKVPDSIEILEAFPRTSVGKIQKHLLRQKHEEGKLKST
ncbi:AMP-binding protein [Cytobacillus purgationiresistens]|uniref:Crotonobetaine/carnitine-CoA ligase n=1 Tax=Cytobacillus purgationiresistens TaxID=863449 RepID=A0ABU0AGC6_9BACI|nr:AMP-binding protein [Cytobacillus purgationiresistens]MDQ0269150.1 crotonobetaine/carnitine-CoA ligase [Cytobacillus purgationiresistens]